MAKVNYIAHLNAVFSRFYDDRRLNPTHRSLYMALFQYWNIHRFSNTFTVARSELMKLSGISSNTTYSNCLKDLQSWGYIMYNASSSPYVKSEFGLTPMVEKANPTSPKNGRALDKSSPNNGQVVNETSPNFGQDMYCSSPKNGLDLVSNKTYKLKHIKQREKTEESTRSLEEMKLFFKENGFPISVAEKFFNHYEASHWKFPNGAKIEDWKAAARKWMIREKQLNGTGLVQKMDYLHTSNKNKYDEPL